MVEEALQVQVGHPACAQVGIPQGFVDADDDEVLTVAERVAGAAQLDAIAGVGDFRRLAAGQGLCDGRLTQLGDFLRQILPDHLADAALRGAWPGVWPRPG